MTMGDLSSACPAQVSSIFVVTFNFTCYEARPRSKVCESLTTRSMTSYHESQPRRSGCNSARARRRSVKGRRLHVGRGQKSACLVSMVIADLSLTRPQRHKIIEFRDRWRRGKGRGPWSDKKEEYGPSGL